MSKITHWTDESTRNYLFSVSSDFVDQLDSRLDQLEWTRSNLAEQMQVTEGRVSQIFNNPGNLTLRSMIECSRHVGMKLSILAYDDNDPENHRGPINSQVFHSCWDQLGKPYDGWTLEDNIHNYRQEIKKQLEFDFSENWQSILNNCTQQHYRPERFQPCHDSRVEAEPTKVEQKLTGAKVHEESTGYGLAA